MDYSSLVTLLKLGAIGASLAFLVLSQYLLVIEIKRKEARNNVLEAISRHRNAALIFLVIGVLSELLLSKDPEIIDAIKDKQLALQLVQSKLLQWGFSPEVPSLDFLLQRIDLVTSAAVTPTEANDLKVYVGVRDKGANASNVGKYPLLFGPYGVTNTDLKT